MSKSYTSQKREQAAINPAGVRLHALTIGETLPADVRPFAKGRFVIRAFRAIETWRNLLPIGEEAQRQHRATTEQRLPSASAHRPSNSWRESLISDLYDAWMIAKGADDPDRARGFKKTADAVLTAAGLSTLTEREQRHLREQITAFSEVAARLLD